jgi:hypothetical protein
MPQIQRKTPFYIKTFGVFSANLSDSAKRTVSQNLIISCIKSFFKPNLLKQREPYRSPFFG